MSKEKKNISTHDTLKNIKENRDNYSFEIKEDTGILGISETFKKGIEVVIKNIELKEETGDKTHNVKIEANNKEYKLSGGVFIKNFGKFIEEELISYKEIKKIKNETKKTISDSLGKNEKKKKTMMEKYEQINRIKKKKQEKKKNKKD